MKTIKTIRDLKLKNEDTVIPQGTELVFVRHSEMPTVGVFSFNGRELKMRYRTVIKNPTMRSLEKWSMDGICKSVFGAKVEPDGYGVNGQPSWLIAMGMI